MTAVHGGRCCNHEPHDNVDQHDEIFQTAQILTIAASAGCCGGAKAEETSRPHDHAGHCTEVRSPS